MRFKKQRKSAVQRHENTLAFLSVKISSLFSGKKSVFLDSDDIYKLATLPDKNVTGYIQYSHIITLVQNKTPHRIKMAERSEAKSANLSFS